MGREIVRVIVGSPNLRRVVAAFAGFNLADWARWLAILVYAFQRGGAAESGAISLLQLLPAAIVAPIAANLGDRSSRRGMLLLAHRFGPGSGGYEPAGARSSALPRGRHGNRPGPPDRRHRRAPASRCVTIRIAAPRSDNQLAGRDR